MPGANKGDPRVTSAKKIGKLRQSFQFLLAKEETAAVFMISELGSATGWKKGTISTYLGKKWKPFVHRASGGSGYRVQGISSYTEDEYTRLMSQRDEVSADPRRPQLRPEVEALVRKARESALLALHVYNSPSTVFRTEGFAVLMVIAWTALFHALFEQRGEDYFYTGDDGTPKLVDGDKKAWELGTCMATFWPAGAEVAVRSNLEFFIKFRNRVEHRYVPALDVHVAGECQALLLNFDEMLVQNFGSYFAIRESLAVPLQTSSFRTVGQAQALRKLQTKHFDDMKEFVDAYRRDLAPEVYEDSKFAFRVFLIPKTGNHAKSSDLAYEFVKYDPSRPEEMAGLQKQITLIKEKQIAASNANLFKAKDVVKQVQGKIGRTFNLHHHKLAYLKFKVRKRGFDAGACNTTYCVPDHLHKDYGYSQAWIDLLVGKLSNADEYAGLVGYEPTPSTVL
jgi:hypothetical protein